MQKDIKIQREKNRLRMREYRFKKVLKKQGQMGEVIGYLKLIDYHMQEMCKFLGTAKPMSMVELANSHNISALMKPEEKKRPRFKYDEVKSRRIPISVAEAIQLFPYDELVKCPDYKNPDKLVHVMDANGLCEAAKKLGYPDYAEYLLKIRDAARAVKKQRSEWDPEELLEETRAVTWPMAYQLGYALGVLGENL